MSLLLRTVQKESERIDYLLAAYQKQLDDLPKGSIVIKTVGQNVYYYLKYRTGKKVFTDYLGKEGEKVQCVRLALEKRRHIESMIAHFKSEQILANRLLEGNV